jgi:eukaryotic-like serine/threonine-protein kinase
MIAERWQQVEDLFHRALEHSQGLRARFLAEECGNDSALLREVESLLEAFEQEPQFLEEPAARISEYIAGEDDPMIGAMIGVWRIVEPIGQGGMGKVYRAERADGAFAMTAAVKVVKRGMDTEEIVRRFRDERQILASLDHPNIARLLDGGMTTDGRPYVVMEYIDGGIALDEYCDQRRLGIESRMELFRTVCSAVHYAHQHVVVHRDLKMSNILVSKEGDVKLLDFGIAKILSAIDDAANQTMTATALRMLTPEYASPEQVRGEPITTASDTYSLGVLLYELLTGHRPYHLKSRSVMDIERIICTEEPTRPSTVVMREEQTVASGRTRAVLPKDVASARGIGLSQLRRRLAGDLDNVVLKAMQKDPRRRYSSVADLSEDIARHLNSLPVIARADSLGYRMGKFIGRHRYGVAAASALFTSVSGFGVVMAVQRSRIARQAKEITQQRDKAEQVVIFLKDLFRVSDPRVSKGELITARELLEQGAERIEEQLQGQPALQAELMEIMGEVFLNLGLYDRSEAIFRQGHELAKSIFGEESVEAASSLYNIAGALRSRGKFVEAEAIFRQVLAMEQRLLKSESPETLNALGVVLQYLGKYQEAEEFLWNALETRRKQPETNHRGLALTLNNLGSLLRETGRREEAATLYSEAVETQRTWLGEEHPELALSLNNLAGLLSSLGHRDVAASLYKESLAIRRKVLGEHPQVAVSLNNLGSLHFQLGDMKRAEECFREALVIGRQLLEPGHPDVEPSITNLAQTLREQGAFEEAEALFNEALAIQRTSFGDEGFETGLTLNALAELAVSRNDDAAAERYYREADVSFRRHLGNDHRRTAMNALGLGQVLTRRRQYAEAEALLQESHATLQVQDQLLAEQAGRALIELYEHLRNHQQPT